MNVVVSVERHYRRTRDGIVCRGSEHVGFFQRYLDVFDRVLVLGRVEESDRSATSDERPTESGDVEVLPLVDFEGMIDALRVAPRLLRRMWRVAGRRDVAFILRAPGFVQLLFWLVLRARRRPYGVEVVTDPLQAYRSSAFGGGRMGALIRWVVTTSLRSECRRAVATSYVTRRELQEAFPPGGGPTFHYSSIELPRSVFERSAVVLERLQNQANVLDKPCLVFIGNLDRPFKGLDVLIDALGSFREDAAISPRLRVVGDGRLREEYEARADANGLANRVDFLGYIPPGEAVFEILAAGDLFVLPSRREGLPRAVIEAMAVGLPCICSRVSGAQELLEDEFIVPQEDPDTLAATIARLCRSRELRVDAGRRNAERARDYANDRLQRRRNAFYRAVITGSTEGGGGEDRTLRREA